MRKRTLLYSVGLFCLTAIGMSFLSNDQKVADFAPRTDNQEIQGWNDAQANYNQLRANVETGEVNPEDAIRMANAVKKFAKANATQKDSAPIAWTEMGPDNVGGRTRAILPIDEMNIIAGGVSGGLWRTTNSGNDWTQITSFPNCNVGAICQAGNGDIYVGTGSSFDGAGASGGSGFIGQGVYRSTDGGETWNVIPDTDTGILGLGDWTATNALEADPNNPDRVWVGGPAGHGNIVGETLTMNDNDGLPNQVCQDIHIATDGSYMLVAMGSGRVYRSVDSNFSIFEEEFGSGDGNLPPGGAGRARVYVVPGAADHAYVLYATTGGLFGGVHYSGDGGQTWSEIWPSGTQLTPLPRGQGIYDLCLGASPDEPEIAFVGGIEFWRCGPNYQPELAAIPADIPGLDTDMHVDMHEIVYSAEGTMWVGCDGGIYKSYDNGETYIETNRGFNTTQYYGIAFTPNNGAIGGTQDNGSHFIPNDGTFISDLSAFDVTGGDGFDCAVPQVTDVIQGTAFTTSQYGVLFRASEGGAIAEIYDEEVLDIADDEGEIGQFHTCIQLFEDTEDDDSPQVVFLTNPYEETVTDSTFVLETNSLNIPFEYTLEGELRFWEELPRPARTEDELLTVDPVYPFLDPQELTSEMVDCDTMFTQIGEEEVIDEIIPVDSCFYFEPLDSIICITVDLDTTYTMEPVFDIEITCDTTYFYEADTLYNVREQIAVQDPYTTMLAVGFTGGLGVWMTRDGLNFNVSPNWWRLGDAPSGFGGTSEIEFVVGDHEAAGDVMFVAGKNGDLWRVSGLDNLWTDEDYIDHVNNDTGEFTAVDEDGNYVGDGYLDVLDWDLIYDGTVPIVGFGVDPNDPNHVVIARAGYGGSQKVLETFNALDEDIASNDWDNIWFTSGDLVGMPCYDAVIDMSSSETIVVGTEFGAWITNDGGDTWVPSNEGMQTASDVFACPIFDIRQQHIESRRWTYPTNSGYIYAGTHGRGIFNSDDLMVVGIEEEGDLETAAQNQLLIYPNPISTGLAQVEIDLAANADVTFSVYTSTGKLVKQIPFGQQTAGTRVLNIDVNELANGNYILGADMGGAVKTAHFVIMK